MNSMKTKKGKIAVSFFAIMLIACILTVSMTGCKVSEVGVTPVDVFFVGSMQQNPSDTSGLMKEDTELVSVKTMLDTENWTLEEDPYDVIAGIYALAVTNYNNVNRAAYMIMTDSSVNAFKCSNLGNKDVNVGIRSTYSNYRGANGYFEQTVSGVTVLDGLGGVIGKLRSNFGWNSQVYQNDEFRIEKKGFNAGAEYYGEGNNASNATKYIMGAGNPKLDKAKEGYKGELIANMTPSVEEDFDSQRKYAWSELEAHEGDKLTVAGTTYYTGTYGTGWATSNYSNKDYFNTEKTSIDYDGTLDLYTLNITIIDELVDDACDYTKGGLVRDTKDYIALKNAKYIESSAKIEVYGSGLIKSLQKIDTLESNEKCDLTVAGGMLGSCNGGGKASNRITMAFGYDEEACDALRLVALYWPELATDTPFQKAKNFQDKNTKPLKNVKPLDLSKYTTFNDYKPQINDLAGQFISLYSFDWSTYSLDK